MDIADLRLLDAVAVTGSFSAAAAELRLSQPSVSARIAAVERAVGAPLFVRDSRGARLTPAGDRYLGYARRSLALLVEGGRAAAAEPTHAEIRVGVPASYAAGLAPALADAATACRLTLSLRASHSRELRADLRDSRIDLALVTSGVVPVGLASRHAGTTAILALAAPGVTAAPGAQFAVHRWSEAAEDVISALLGQGIARDGITVVSPAAAAISLAVHRGHIAVVPELTAQPEIDAGRLQPLPLQLPALDVPLDWLHHSARQVGPVQRFIQHADIMGRGAGTASQ
jgi:DNA-binding transcriptional LysR family regulator